MNDPIASNYRGIALLSCVSKVFTKILNNWLTNWAEGNDKMYEVQGEFTKGNSTIDQIFVFQIRPTIKMRFNKSLLGVS